MNESLIILVLCFMVCLSVEISFEKVIKIQGFYKKLVIRLGIIFKCKKINKKKFDL